MIVFPVFNSLTLEQYGLYPPSSERPFRIEFLPGPTAIVGVNGSGKTTLINIVLHCLTGPFNLPAATSEAELGQVRARVVPMERSERQMFARRVADGARSALATLHLQFGDDAVAITRRLSDLSLVSFNVNEVQVPTGDRHREDETYQEQMAELFSVATFFDVLIVLRFLTFMLEDRRALVWDPTAQRQIFRVLLLQAERDGVCRRAAGSRRSGQLSPQHEHLHPPSRKGARQSRATGPKNP